jgi:signal transduction histidine kinase
MAASGIRQGRHVTHRSDRRLRAAAVVAAVVLMIVGGRYALEAGAPPLSLAGEIVVSGSFLLTGLFAWSRRPSNQMGLVMVLVGLSLLLIPFAGPPLLILYPVGLIGFTIANVLIGYLILAFPSGELRSNANRALIALTAVVTFLPRFFRLLGQDPAAQGSTLVNPYLVIHDSTFVAVTSVLPYLMDIVLLALFVSFAAARWITASGPARRGLLPMMVPTMAILITLLVESFVTLIDVPAAIKEFSSVAQFIVRAALPIGFLVGLLRIWMARGAVADLVVELGETPTPARMRDALAHALGDPRLTVAYWSADAADFVGPDGSPIAMPVDGSGRAVTALERNGMPLATIVHDAALLDDPGLVASVAGALRLAVENDRLHAEVATQLDEVRASRARVVAAGDAERKRLERDLHDGAQQRLVSLTLALRLARTKLGADGDPDLALSLDQASGEAKAALAELRELARGIHPQILTEAGLEAALQALADRSPLDVSLESGTTERFSAAVEGAAYFVVSEALANVAKYAHASHALVRTGSRDGGLTIEIADDGVGGADPAGGSGLRGLADRLAAVDGTLEITSPTGGGTRLLARIPTNVAAGSAGLAL